MEHIMKSLSIISEETAKKKSRKMIVAGMGNVQRAEKVNDKK
jgi:hypothetical protein